MATSQEGRSAFFSVEENRLQRLRNNWDPFDSYDKVLRDGNKVRNGTLTRPSEHRRVISKQIRDGEFHLDRATPKSTDVVYFIQATEGGPVKIGHSTYKAVANRVESLQTSHHQELAIRGLFDGGVWLEVALHELFADFRIRGEWFRVSPLMKELCEGVILDGA